MYTYIVNVLSYTIVKGCVVADSKEYIPNAIVKGCVVADSQG